MQGELVNVLDQLKSLSPAQLHALGQLISSAVAALPEGSGIQAGQSEQEEQTTDNVVTSSTQVNFFIVPLFH